MRLHSLTFLPKCEGFFCLCGFSSRNRNVTWWWTVGTKSVGFDRIKDVIKCGINFRGFLLVVAANFREFFKGAGKKAARMRHSGWSHVTTDAYKIFTTSLPKNENDEDAKTNPWASPETKTFIRRFQERNWKFLTTSSLLKYNVNFRHTLQRILRIFPFLCKCNLSIR